MKRRNHHIGSDFDDFLAEEGILAEVEVAAAKRVIAYQLQQTMEQELLTKSALAEKTQLNAAVTSSPTEKEVL